MALQASQSASGAVSTGTSSAAAGGSAGSSPGLLNTMANASQGAQVATALGMSVAVAAAAATGVVAGVALGGTTGSTLPVPEVWSCGNDTVNLPGYVEIMIQFATVEEVEAKKPALEDLFVYAYNNVSGMCDGLFDRILQNATLEEAEDVSFNDTQVVLTKWNAFVNCDGCPEFEPLFSTGILATEAPDDNTITSVSSVNNSFTNTPSTISSSNSVNGNTSSTTFDSRWLQDATDSTTASPAEEAFQNVFANFSKYFADSAPMVFDNPGVRILLFRVYGLDGSIDDEINDPSSYQDDITVGSNLDSVAGVTVPTASTLR